MSLKLILLLQTICLAHSLFEDFQNICKRDLGMESKEIRSDQITSKSHYSDSVQANYGRLNHEENGGAWCPVEAIGNKTYQWIQIDLRAYHVITAVATQGRYGNGQGREYAPQYRLEYQRQENSTRWLRYKTNKGKELFEGNMDVHRINKNSLTPPIIAKAIRIIPVAKHLRTVCMRIELYGCLWQEGLVSYSMRQGDSRRNKGSNIDFVDFTYDGQITGNHLSGGLGQLVDGEWGVKNFRNDNAHNKKKGYEWIGWRNDSSDQDGVRIVFEFDAVRKFEKVYIRCNNYFSKGISVFERAEIRFSVGGKYFNEQPLIYKHTKDETIAKTRNVIISLHNRTGRFIEMKLYHSKKWILISEVTFKSVRAVGNFTPEVPVQPQTTSEVKEEFMGVIMGAVCSVIVISLIGVIALYVRHRRMKNLLSSIGYKDGTISIRLTDARITNGKLSNGTRYKGVATSEQDEKVIEGYTGPCENSPYAIVADFPNTFNPAHICPPAYNSQPPPPPLPPMPNDPISELPSIQGVVGSCVYAAANCNDLIPTAPVDLIDFPRDCLKVREKLGEGQFGEVHLCEVEGANDRFGEEFTYFQGLPFLVAVKMIRQDADIKAKCDFHKEIRLQSRLRDPNIVGVLGVVRRDDPVGAVTEYMHFGDLHAFLQGKEPYDDTIRKGKNQISHGALTYMATQIASGMKYLESLNLVHRDLACRNCLVGYYYTVKISDFGMSRGLYSADYYRMEGRAVLPIRWMAWESILLGRFSSKSDVWSFGVTLWEILTFARHQPYDALTDEEVIENCSSFYRDNRERIYLPQPNKCPKEIYDLMIECWNRDDTIRPTFREIHMFLQRKNSGYNPRDDDAVECEQQLPIF